jgi:hypothetical protein
VLLLLLLVVVVVVVVLLLLVLIQLLAVLKQHAITKLPSLLHQMRLRASLVLVSVSPAVTGTLSREVPQYLVTPSSPAICYHFRLAP